MIQSHTFVIYRKLTGAFVGLMFERRDTIPTFEFVNGQHGLPYKVKEDYRGKIAIETETHVFQEDGYADRN